MHERAALGEQCLRETQRLPDEPASPEREARREHAVRGGRFGELLHGFLVGDARLHDAEDDVAGDGVERGRAEPAEVLGDRPPDELAQHLFLPGARLGAVVEVVERAVEGRHRGHGRRAELLDPGEHALAPGQRRPGTPAVREPSFDVERVGRLRGEPGDVVELEGRDEPEELDHLAEARAVYRTVAGAGRRGVGGGRGARDGHPSRIGRAASDTMAGYLGCPVV